MNTGPPEKEKPPIPAKKSEAKQIAIALYPDRICLPNLSLILGKHFRAFHSTKPAGGWPTAGQFATPARENPTTPESRCSRTEQAWIQLWVLEDFISVQITLHQASTTESTPMPTFNTSLSSDTGPTPGIRMTQIMEAVETTSSKGNLMFRLEHAILPSRHSITDFLVFTENAFWRLRDFCASANIELPAQEAEVNLEAENCVGRVCFIQLDYEEGTDDKRRLRVKRYLTREDALKRDASLAQIAVPRNAPGPKKLAPINSQEGAAPLAQARESSTARDAEPDDIPF